MEHGKDNDIDWITGSLRNFAEGIRSCNPGGTGPPAQALVRVPDGTELRYNQVVSIISRLEEWDLLLDTQMGILNRVASPGPHPRKKEKSQAAIMRRLVGKILSIGCPPPLCR